MKKQEHLSFFGIGPLYAMLCVAVTVTAYLFGDSAVLPAFSVKPILLLMKVIAIIFGIIAASLWISAVLIQKIDKNIKENKLVQTGSYAWVRNPIYSAIMFVMWAVLAWTGNPYLLIFYPIYPFLMTLLLKRTEEKWLSEKYGEEYRQYCGRVNRCFPWMPKK